MFDGYRSVLVSCALGIGCATLPYSVYARPIDPVIAIDPVLASDAASANAEEVLPDAPAPAISENEVPDGQNSQQPAPSATGQQAGSGQNGSGQSSSSAQSASAQPDSQEKKREEAEEQVKQEEKQRVLGIVPNFNITYLGAATVSLTPKEKIGLAFHTVTDPVAFAIPFFVAGYNEALDNDRGFPWGVKGLGERAGAAYLDSFDGNMIGNGFLPALLHQDPRYFRMGYGTTTHRILYSLATNVVARHDNTGKWEPNYSNIGGNIVGGAISNLYYPGNDSGVGLTITNGLIVTGEGALGSLFDEFWPDISRKVLHKDPTHGQDDRTKAQYEQKMREKAQARQQSVPSN